MPGIVSLVSQISTDVTSKLAGLGLPPLVDGAILLGRQHIRVESSPPRIVFIPMGSAFSAKSLSARSQVSGNPSANEVLQWQQRSVLTDLTRYEVHCWGTANATTPDSDTDFDATQLLYQQVIASIHLLTVGRYRILSGEWADQQVNAGQWIKIGHEYVFEVEFGTPVLEQLLPLVPNGTTANPTTQIQPADGGAPETGCSG